MPSRPMLTTPARSANRPPRPARPIGTASSSAVEKVDDEVSARQRLTVLARATSAVGAVHDPEEGLAALADDLDAPRALAAVDAWADASLAIDADDTDAPALVARTVDALLGIVL